MKRLAAPAVAFVGACLFGTGFWWLWTGFDIIQVERGWATVIAGATLLCTGLILGALAAVLMRLGEIARGLVQAGQVLARPEQGLARSEQGLVQAGQDSMQFGVQDPVASPTPTPESKHIVVDDSRPADTTRPLPVVEAKPAARAQAQRPTAAAPSRQTSEIVWPTQRPPEPTPAKPSRGAIVDQHVVGDTTYVIFADGSVEAKTPEGAVTFESIDALQSYAEEQTPSAATLGLRT